MQFKAESAFSAKSIYLAQRVKLREEGQEQFWKRNTAGFWNSSPERGIFLPKRFPSPRLPHIWESQPTSKRPCCTIVCAFSGLTESYSLVVQSQPGQEEYNSMNYFISAIRLIALGVSSGLQTCCKPFFGSVSKSSPDHPQSLEESSSPCSSHGDAQCQPLAVGQRQEAAALQLHPSLGGWVAHDPEIARSLLLPTHAGLSKMQTKPLFYSI